MNLSFFIAKRYFFTKKKQNAINIISIISMLGVSVGSFAFVVVLSAFNGLDGLISSLFSSFDPDLKVFPIEGKTFAPDSTIFTSLEKLEGVHSFSRIVEDNALLKYGDKQRPAVVKGVEQSFIHMTGIDSMLVAGSFKLQSPEGEFAVLGYGVAYDLNISLNFLKSLTFYVPKRKMSLGHNPMDAFRSSRLYPEGYFMIEEGFDSKYVLVSLDFARKLFSYKNEISALEIKLMPDADVDSLQEEIQALMGDKLVVKNRYQLHELLYKMMKTEKVFIFIILAFILLVASFNIVASLSMLIIEKKMDIETLLSMGASKSVIQMIFLIEGWLISIVGACLGVFVGISFCLLQDYFGFISLNGGSGIFDAYPVDVHFTDIILIFTTVLSIGYLASRFPVRFITKSIIK